MTLVQFTHYRKHTPSIMERMQARQTDDIQEREQLLREWETKTPVLIQASKIIAVWEHNDVRTVEYMTDGGYRNIGVLETMDEVKRLVSEALSHG